MTKQRWTQLSVIMVVLISLVVGFSAVAAKKRRDHGKNLKRYRSGEVIVKFWSGVPMNTGTQRLGTMYRARRHRDLDRRRGIALMKVAPGQTVEQTVQQLSGDPSVEYVQPNYIYRATATTPNDTDYAKVWGLNNTGQTIAGATYSTHNPGTASMDIGAESAWDITTDCSNAPVAVIDTGVNYNHNDLAANMWDGGVTYPNHGYDFVDSDNDPMDFNGHGTHVAGTIAAVGNNGTGSTGVCWTANIMALRVLDSTGAGVTADIVSAINFAVDNGAKVINMSLGGSSYDSAFNTAVSSASSAGVVIVVAAGNDGTNNDLPAGTQHTYPCDYTASNLLCVAALDQSFSLASFSNYGYTSVDVGAPGTNVHSSWHGTVTAASDALSGWTTNNGRWVDDIFAPEGTTYDFLVNPATFSTGGNYVNNADDRAYKSFNLSAYDAATFDFYAIVGTQSSTDYFKVGYHTGGTDPFTGGTQLDSMSGSSSGTSIQFEYDISSCVTATCALGFNLTSNATTVSTGVAVSRFYIRGLTLNNTTYALSNGTSMATPFVAGMAAMVKSYNPDYTAADVVTAIKNSGTSRATLSAKTSTGKSVNLYNALKYISTPTGISAGVQRSSP